MGPSDVVVCHVLAAITVGPILTIPMLASAPSALRAVLILLRFGAGATLLSGVALWSQLRPSHASWLYLSSALFVVVIVVVGVVVSPAAKRLGNEPALRGRVRFAGIVSSAIVFLIAGLMVLRPSWS